MNSIFVARNLFYGRFWFFFSSFFFSFIFTLLLYFMRFSAPCKMASIYVCQSRVNFHLGTPFKRCICIQWTVICRNSFWASNILKKTVSIHFAYIVLYLKIYRLKKTTLIHYFEFQFSMAFHLFYSALVNFSASKYF